MALIWEDAAAAAAEDRQQWCQCVTQGIMNVGQVKVKVVTIVTVVVYSQL